MHSDSPPMTLSIPSDLRLLPVVRVFVESACQTGGLDQTSTDAVVLATYEALTNVIRHAHRGQPAAQIQIQCRYLNDGIEICLHDESEERFDLTAVPHMDPGEIRVGGRGVYLMRSLMDELSCEPRGERGNTLRMVKRCAREFPEKI